MKILIALFLFALSPNPSHARATDGWENGNAGDTFSAEFILTARDLVQRMKLLPPSELGEINLNSLAGAVLSAKVHSEETLLLDGYEVDAINYPARQEIVLSRTRWRALRQPSETTQRLMLVLHEYLFLVGIDDTQFRFSGQLVPQLGVKNFNPNRWWNPLNPVNRVSLGLVYRPGDCTLPSLDFDLLQSEEAKTVSATGDCGDAFRRVTVTKNSFTAPPSSQARGTFHRYEIRVEDKDSKTVGLFSFEPEWGKCLLAQDGSCQLSGKIFTGGVEFIFWLLR